VAADTTAIEMSAAGVFQPLLPLATVRLGFSRMGRFPLLRNRTFFLFEGESYTYRQAYLQAERFAGLFSKLRSERVADGTLAADQPLNVALYQENTPEFLFAVFGAALSGDIVFGINTGARAETLATILDKANIHTVITDPERRPWVDEVVGDVVALASDRVFTVGESLDDATRPSHPVDARKIDGQSPLLVIYTSGTTSAPKGVPCTHMKLWGAGYLMAWRAGIRPSDRGYITLPLFHSNAWLLGVLPLMALGGSFVLRRRFSASAFEGDMLENGVTYMNYVGHPIRYILDALEKKHDDVEAALSREPANRFRIAMGNGASPADREKLIRYLGMHHIYEIYGSTEAPITTVVQPGDPADSVGRIKTSGVTILDDDDQPCPPAEVDDSGRITNYDEAVGEIVRKMDEDNIFFTGYLDNPDASSKKFRGGYYRSGDLGHIRIGGAKPYLYFDGRTDDWIRKDGENFSAENVVHHLVRYAPVALAAAYGVPCAVSDERVMAALQLRDGASFDPQDAFDWLVAQQAHGLDLKWMPDYIRVVDAMPMSPTEKIVVRQLKRTGFDLTAEPEAKIYFRQRGDTTYRAFGQHELEELTEAFRAAGRANLISR